MLFQKDSQTHTKIPVPAGVSFTKITVKLVQIAVNLVNVLEHLWNIPFFIEHLLLLMNSHEIAATRHGVLKEKGEGKDEK